MGNTLPSKPSGSRARERLRRALHSVAVRAKHPNTILTMWFFLLVLLVVFTVGFIWRTNQLAGTRVAPGPGTVMPMGQRELAELDRAWGDRSGFIVWSSTMYGQHDLVRMEWPSGQMERLTRSPAVDTSPKISPNGKLVTFARSRQEWVPFRDREEWDVWLLDIQSGTERRLAERGAEPCWTRGGQAVAFQRGGREVVQVDMKTGEETVLLAAPAKTIWTEPSVDPAGNRVAVTVQGKRPRTSIISVPDGAETRVADGSQLSFAPTGTWLVQVEEGGRADNRICRADPNGAKLEEFLNMAGYWSHEDFPRVSNDGALLVFGAAREGRELDTADYEIFMWHIGDSPERAARVSFHTGNDQWPDVFVYPER
jgi:Tol biopolymer transport system component